MRRTRQHITILIIFITCFSTVHGQDISFELFYNLSCSDTVIKADYFCLEKGSQEYPSYEPDNGVCFLPDTGYYKLKYAGLDPLYQPVFHVTGSKHIDTLIIPRVHLITIIRIGPSDRVYMDCDKRSDGRIIDYWENGEIKLLGNFKNGYPTDTLYRTDIDGQVIEFKVKTTRFEYHYSSDSTLVSKTHLKRQSLKIYENGVVLYSLNNDRNRDIKKQIFTDTLKVKHVIRRRQKFRDLRHDAKYVYRQKSGWKCNKKVFFYWRGSFPWTYEGIKKEDIIREK